MGDEEVGGVSRNAIVFGSMRQEQRDVGYGSNRGLAPTRLMESEMMESEASPLRAEMRRPAADGRDGDVDALLRKGESFRRSRR